MAAEPTIDQRRGLPTEYRGWMFRSRLEARYAVFFDELGVRWQYEPDGFSLPSGLYVPDFYLPDLAWWVEVKPRPVPDPKRANDLAVELAVATGQAVVLAVGAPGSNRQGWSVATAVVPGEGQVVGAQFQGYWTSCRRGHVDIVARVQTWPEYIELWTSGPSGRGGRLPRCAVCLSLGHPDATRDAGDVAQRAYFERLPVRPVRLVTGVVG